jgi:hypothetical protein
MALTTMPYQEMTEYPLHEKHARALMTSRTCETAAWSNTVLTEHGEQPPSARASGGDVRTADHARVVAAADPRDEMILLSACRGSDHQEGFRTASEP